MNVASKHVQCTKMRTFWSYDVVTWIHVILCMVFWRIPSPMVRCKNSFCHDHPLLGTPLTVTCSDNGSIPTLNLAISWWPMANLTLRAIHQVCGFPYGFLDFHMSDPSRSTVWMEPIWKAKLGHHLYQPLRPLAFYVMWLAETPANACRKRNILKHRAPAHIISSHGYKDT